MSAVSSPSFSFRSPEPPMAAAELLAEIRARGGRVYRMRRQAVFCLTDSVELAEWLLKRGGKPYSTTPASLEAHVPPGAYFRTRERDKVEFDIWVHTIPTADPLWEALG